MPDWKGYYRLAKRLNNMTGVTGAKRSAVSRAYYAAFMTAFSNISSTTYDALFRREMGNRKVRPHHKLVADFYKSSTNPREQKIGNDLSMMHKYRCQCDYDEKIENQLKITDLTLITAKDVLNHFT